MSPIAPSEPTAPTLAQPASVSEFVLPAQLEAREPPEARGLARDEVRLMISYRADDRIVHTSFRRLPESLAAGDLLVINTSGTMNAALPATRAGGATLELHLSTHLPADLWLVEVRRPEGATTVPFPDAVAGETLALPATGRCTLHVPHRHDRTTPSRLWIASLALPESLHEYLDRHGFPIRYGYVERHWPLQYYQTVYATERGSAEMPSAGRAFTPELLTALVARGVVVAPLLLHTGVASVESHEAPYEEYYRIPEETARQVNAARAAGRRVIAVGTTVVRALETTASEDGTVHPGEGWTRLVVTPQRGIRAIDALLTGLHEPRSTHLLMLRALAGDGHLARVYEEAIRERYLWHEFGDLHLLLP